MSEEMAVRIKELGARVREARRALHMSQATLAEKSGLSISQISQIERGKNDPKTQSFIRIIEALQVPADQILRADVPRANEIGQHEYSDLLSDCTPQEVETLVAFTRQLKDTIRKNKSIE